jgi:hypothetical protein
MNMLMEVMDVPKVWNNLTPHVGVFCNICSPLRRLYSLYGSAINKIVMLNPLQNL